MTFNRLQLEDMELLRPYFDLGTTQACNYTPGTLFMWRKYYDLHYALVDEPDLKALYFMVPSAGRCTYQLPITNNLEQALLKLLEETGEDRLFLEVIPEEELALISSMFDVSNLFEDRENFDYIYKVNDLAQLKGRGFAGQRNQISQFIRGADSWEIKEIGSDTLPALRDFFNETYMPQAASGFLERCENEAVWEALCHPEVYRLSGIVLWRNGEIVGFSMGEKRRDTLFVHVEKSVRSLHGAYQLLVKNLAMMFCDGDTVYINREDDSDDEGLRRSKMSYHPDYLLKKYSFTISKKSVK